MNRSPSGRESLVPPAVDTLPINVAILDDEGTILWTNRAWQEYGRKNDIGMRPDTIGVNYLDVTGEGDDEFARKAYAELDSLLAGEIDQFEFEYPCHSEDEYRWFLMRAVAYTIGEDHYVAVAHVDITEQKLREWELRTFKEAAEQSGHSICITDSSGVIEYVNPTFAERTGYDREEAVGETPAILNSGEHDDEFYREMWETITGGEIWESEITNQRKDGEQYVVNQTIAPITDDDGSITHFVAINQEITDRVEYERRLKEQRDNLELLNQVVRHDIRNDLQLIHTYAELLQEHVEGEGEEYLDQVQESVENAIDLTTTARDLSDVMLQTESDTEPVSLRRALVQQMEDLRATYPDAEVTLEGSVPTVQVRANDMLEAVFRNLLKNAIQHNDKDIPEVTVSATADDENAVVRIADNGPGIPDERKEEIFGKGKRGLESQGTGVGLYLVRELVTDYGGEVWVEDRADDSSGDTAGPGGAVFVVQLGFAS